MTEKKQGICFSGWVSSVLLLAFALACSPRSKENDKLQVLHEYFEDNNIHAFSERTESVLVLSEEGCITCNKSYALLLEKLVNSPKCVIVINASGTRLDISDFSSDSITNVYFDDKDDFRSLGLLESSGAIFIGGKKIDTIVELNAKGLEEQLSFINKRIK